MSRHNKFTKLIMVAAASFLWHSANAAIITFDDLGQNAVDEEGYLIPLSNEYAAQGVTFEGTIIYSSSWGANSGKTGKYVEGLGATILFSGELPTYVSLIVGNFMEYAVGVSAYGPGFYESQTTPGDMHGITVDPSELKPYKPDQLVEFTSVNGISSINISGQAGYYFDDLKFFYNNEKVPEPKTLLLFSVGLMGLMLSRRRVKDENKISLLT